MTTAVTSTPARSQGTARLRSLWPSRLPVVMAVVNCTPDSFSDGGRCFDYEAAINHAEQLITDGATIIDIGGESTRPGAGSVDIHEELRRVLPVIRELRRRHPSVVLSVDTSKAEVAAATLTAGADIVNDVSAGSDPDMLPTVAAADAGIVLMHMRGSPRTMQDNPTYDNVVAEVHHELLSRAAAAQSAGVETERIWLDPGIGFGKDDHGNLELLAALGNLAAHGFPVLIGPSRKSFIGRLAGADVDDRLPGTLAALVPAAGLTRVVVRVHDPAPTMQFLEILTSINEARP